MDQLNINLIITIINEMLKFIIDLIIQKDRGLGRGKEGR